MSKMEMPNSPQYTPYTPTNLFDLYLAGFDLNHQESKPQPKTDCYFYEECQDGPWCKYRHYDPTCENCKAYIAKKQVDAMARKMVDNG